MLSMKKRCLAWTAAAAMAAAAQQPGYLKEVLAQVAKYEYGQSRAALIDLGDVVRKTMASPAERQRVEAALGEFLQSNGTRAGKDAVCRELSIIGSERSAPVLMDLLADPSMAEIARYALERIPGPKIDAALRAAVARNNGKAKIGIINTLGRRRDAGAVPTLKPLLANSDPAIVSAAAHALARIADAPARAALSAALTKSTGAQHVGIAESLILCADRLMQEGQKPAALAIHKKLYQPGEPVMIRIAALTGLAESGESAVPALTAAVRENDPQLQAVAIRALGRLPGDTAAKALMEALPRLPPAAQVQALTALADRGDRTALPLFIDVLKAQDAGVRVAGVEGLGKIGDKAMVVTLARIAVTGSPGEQIVARQSLYTMRGSEIDQAIVAGLAAGDPKVRVELIRASGERGIRAAAAPLLSAAKDDDAAVRREALRALREVAGPEQTPELISLLQTAGPGAERRDAQRALLAALRQSKQSHSAELQSAYGCAADVEAKAALLETLAQTGAVETLPLFREVLAKGDDESRRAAINALSQWTSAAPAPDLLQVARIASNPAQRILALRGYINLVGLPAGRQPAETAKMLADALELATQPAEKRAVLAALQREPSPDALRLAESLLEDASVAAEAKTAVDALTRGLSRR